MAYLTIAEASAMTGIARTTLYRKAEKGVLSLVEQPDGSKKIDTSELFRVYPQKSDETPKVIHEGHEPDMLKQEILHLKAMLQMQASKFEEIIKVKDQVIAVQEQSLRLLEHKIESQPVPPEKVRWWNKKIW